MSRRFALVAVVASLVGGLGVMLAPGTARADLVPVCGNLDFSGHEMCKVETMGGCTAQCTPVNVDLSCAASFEAMCSGMCNASLDVNCQAMCDTTCMESCSGNPGSFDCSGSCNADCSGHCQSDCSSNANQSQCEASCKATCGADCNVKCQAVPPMASCSAECMGSCGGSCTAQANINCQVNCQASLYANCEATVTGGCMAQCSQPSGALFCNGEFVNTNSVNDCINQLKALFPTIYVDASASGDCTGNTCMGQAQGSIKCGIAAAGEPAMSGGFFAAGLGFAGIALGRRLRRKAR
jgi:hypothetical protein